MIVSEVNLLTSIKTFVIPDKNTNSMNVFFHFLHYFEILHSYQMYSLHGDRRRIYIFCCGIGQSLDMNKCQVRTNSWHLQSPV